jgi:membrane-bound metal-dependent hydrolase YbcI (DUF457 family)
MDTITHGIVGALAGKALSAGRDGPAGFAKNGESRALSSPTARAAIVACTLGAMFPDIDIFPGPLARNPLAIMEWHRNITHSAVMLPLWALLLATVSIPLARWLKWKAPPFLTLFAIYALGIGTHIFLDLVTNFGIMVWSPLRYSRPAWDWIFILDLTLTAIALVPQLAAWCYREPGQFWRRSICVWAALTVGAFGTYLFASAEGYGFPIAVAGVVSAILGVTIFLPAAQGAGFRWTRARWCRAGLAVLCVYIGLAAAAHHKAFADVERFTAAQHLQVENLAALPLPPTLTHWVGLVSTPEGVWRTTFHEPGGAIESTQFYADAQSSEFIERAKKLRDVQVFLWFARYPIWRVRHGEAQQTVIEISDLRFFREHVPDAVAAPQPSTGVSGIRPRPAGFTFEVVFDSGGRIISHGFREPE